MTILSFFGGFFEFFFLNFSNPDVFGQLLQKKNSKIKKNAKKLKKASKKKFKKQLQKNSKKIKKKLKKNPKKKLKKNSKKTKKGFICQIIFWKIFPLSGTEVPVLLKMALLLYK